MTLRLLHKFDREFETAMGLTQYRLDGPGVCSAGEDEAQIFVPLGKRNDLLTNRNTDRHVLNAGHRPRRLNSTHLPKRARPWDRDHHDPGRPRPPLRGSDRQSLERENRELRQANEILRKASAYFAQAELQEHA